MPVIHTNRSGTKYYLHTGPKRGGGIQYFFLKHLGKDSMYDLY